MKRSAILAVASLVTILLVIVHLADDLARAPHIQQAGFYIAMLVLAVWLYGTLVLSERRSGRVIMLIGSLLGLAIVVVHVSGPGGVLGGRPTSSWAGLLFAWTLFMLLVISIFTLALSVHELWSLRRGREP